MEIQIFKSDMQPSVDDFFEKCFSAVGIPYSPVDRHADIADVEANYMQSGCFWCLFDNDVLIGTVAIRIIDAANKVVELKRMFVLPEYQGKGYGTQAARLAIQILKAANPNMPIKLATERSNAAAQRLYQSLGFEQLTELDGDDLVFGL